MPSESFIGGYRARNDGEIFFMAGAYSPWFMTNIRWAMAALLLTTTLPLPAAETLSGVARVQDADTLEVAGEEVELYGVDAPQLEQRCELGGLPYDCGLIAAGRLAELLAGHTVRCEPHGPGRYTRVIATCTAGGQDVAEALVRQGWALAYRRFTDRYVPAEAQARQQQRGMWRAGTKPSWSWP